MDEKDDCPFCNVSRKFTHTHFEGLREDQPCEAWIDYDKDKTGRFLWYAILSGEQYTQGHTLLILGPHRNKITDCSLTVLELGALVVGLKKVACRLRDILEIETVHVLSLCEGQKHLHFHLIPRYPYSKKEKKFYVSHYSKREENNPNFANDVSNGNIHGMWYTAYHEMKFKNSKFWRHPEDRTRELQDLAKRLRDPNLSFPSFL